MHKSVGCGLFSGRLFGTLGIVRNYYTTLVYQDCTLQKQVRKMYGDGIISVIVEDFNIWGSQLPITFCDLAGNNREAWIVPASFCCMRFVSDGRYLAEYYSTDAQQTTHPQDNNFSFVQMFSADSSLTWRTFSSSLSRLSETYTKERNYMCTMAPSIVVRKQKLVIIMTVSIFHLPSHFN